VWPGQDPVGKQIRLDGSAGFEEDQPRTIVGVVGDVRSLDLKNISDRELYIPYAQSGSSNLSIVVRRRPGIGSLLPQLREQLRSIDPDVPFRSEGSMSDDVELQLATPTFYSTLLALFAGLALVLSAVGLYGVVSYQMSLRRREVGVRMALGARPAGVVRVIAWQGLRPALIGVVLGIGGAAASVRIMRALLFNTSTDDTFTWIVVVGSVLVVAAVASTLPALRAARVTPAEALRSD
jgi:ABC-type antimicrobial peptide transport system permease subunit